LVEATGSAPDLMEAMAAATVAGKSSLSLARVLADSFRRYHPAVPFFVLLADEVEGYFEPGSEPFRLLRLADLRIPNLPRFRFQYSQQELTYALTPALLRHLLDQGFPRVAFLKQESLVLGNLTPVLELLRRRSIVLTPHLLDPLSDEGGAERELNILQSGVYNVGFLGISATPTARAFLSWWEARLHEHCRHDVAHGLHFEQRWLDLVPAYFEDVEVVRDPGFNVAHWNLPERTVAIDGADITVDGSPCSFFRFSGFDPERPHAVTRYSPRLDMSNVGDAAEIFGRYVKLLEAAGYHETKTWPYAYGYFTNGRPVPDRARHLYRRLGDEAERFGDPFDTTSSDSFFRWSRRQMGALGRMKRCWWALHRVVRDVRRALASREG
jgi:hypothetical protein